MAGFRLDLGNASLPVTHKVVRLRQTNPEKGSLDSLHLDLAAICKVHDQGMEDSTIPAFGPARVFLAP